jgi:2-polyprenyl-6-methoxyphenol hydroxylase-like FAD-dependent oxidoreductase
MPPAAPTGPLAAAPLIIGIVGCGTAGPAAAALLARAGHRVTILERAAALGPAGAGILLQPTGMAVLDRLGVLPRILAGGARITHLRGETTRGRVVLDLAYADLRPDLFGLGVQRGLLFTALLDASRSAGAAIRTGVQAVRIDRDAAGRPSVLDAAGTSHGPYDLVLVADGARSALRSACAIARRDRVYPYGAAWVVARDPDNTFAGVLWQAYSGASRMLGVLPTGRLNPDDPADVPSVSLFWSLRLDEADALRAAGPAAFRRRLLDLAPRVAPIAAQIQSMDQVVVAAYNDVLCRSPIDARRGGAVVFLGDAAHAMSPQLGQGANLALADALVLADTLAAAGSAGHTLTRALRRYARLRRGPIGYYALASRWLTPIFQSGLDTLAPLRDLTFGPLCRFPPARTQMLRALAGVKTGVFTSRRLP